MFFPNKCSRRIFHWNSRKPTLKSGPVNNEAELKLFRWRRPNTHTRGNPGGNYLCLHQIICNTVFQMRNQKSDNELDTGENKSSLEQREENRGDRFKPSTFQLGDQRCTFLTSTAWCTFTVWSTELISCCFWFLTALSTMSHYHESWGRPAASPRPHVRHIPADRNTKASDSSHRLSASKQTGYEDNDIMLFCVTRSCCSTSHEFFFMICPSGKKVFMFSCLTEGKTSSVWLINVCLLCLWFTVECLDYDFCVSWLCWRWVFRIWNDSIRTIEPDHGECGSPATDPDSDARVLSGTEHWCLCEAMSGRCHRTLLGVFLHCSVKLGASGFLMSHPAVSPQQNILNS